MPPWGPLVEPYLVEPAARPGEFVIGPRRQQGQMRRAVVLADGVHRHQRLNEIAERPQLDDEDAFARALLERLSFGQGCVFGRSEEHTSELQSLMLISYAVFCFI